LLTTAVHSPCRNRRKISNAAPCRERALYGVVCGQESCYDFYGVQKNSLNQTQSLLAGNVRRLREKAGWTQEQAAGEIGIAPRHYQKIEAGDVNVTVATLVSVATAFRVTVKKLFEEAK